MVNEHEDEAAAEIYRALWGYEPNEPLTDESKAYLRNLLRDAEAADERDRYAAD